MSYSEGRQPCKDFAPRMDHPWGNVHECFAPFDGPMETRCKGRVSLCDNCGRDHHDGGWDTCVGAEVFRAALRKLAAGKGWR